MELTDVAAELARHSERFNSLSNVLDEREKQVAIALAASEKSLRVLFDEREKQVALAFASAERATTKAEEAQKRVNEGQNEFRAVLKDQQATLATKESVDKLDARVQSIERGDAVGVGKAAGVDSTQTLIFKVLPIVVSVGAALFALWKSR